MRVEDLTLEAREAVAAWLRQRADGYYGRAFEALISAAEGLAAVKPAIPDDLGRMLDAAEHARLAEAASALVEAVDPDYVGDLPAALSALASALSLGHDTTERLRALRE